MQICGANSRKCVNSNDDSVNEDQGFLIVDTDQVCSQSLCCYLVTNINFHSSYKAAILNYFADGLQKFDSIKWQSISVVIINLMQNAIAKTFLKVM